MRIVSIVSGGMDSISFAGFLHKGGHELKFVYFNYGQLAHKQEREIVSYFASKLTPSQSFNEIDITKMDLFGKDNILTNHSKREEHRKEFDTKVLVPIRNGVFLTLMTAYAKANNYDAVSFGAHLTDAEHYPDCKKEFTEFLETTLNLGHPEKPTKILSPARMEMTKTQLLREGYLALGNEIFMTVSCYRPIAMKTSGVWWHCGDCASCVERKTSVDEAGLKDKTVYEKI